MRNKEMIARKYLTLLAV